MSAHRTTAPLRAAGVALGMGMGGFVDGIVFHQLLQAHNMLSARIPTDTLIGSKINMFWDGVFHAGVWLLVALGIGLLWRAGRRTDVDWDGSRFIGALLVGWGAFNFIEGLIDHHLLQLHHVYERVGLSHWDYAFLIWGLVMMFAGALLARSRSPSRL